jgi:hypothetical protein
VIHTIAVVAVVISGIAWLYKTVFVITVLMSLWIYRQQELKLKGLTLQYTESIGWEMAFLETSFSPIKVLASTVITHYLIVLHYKTQKQQKGTILIANDALINDKFRKLSVALKLSNQA